MRIWKILLFALIFAGCKQNYTPKPRGYFRIDFPPKTYAPITGNYPYSFDIPGYSSIKHDSRNPNEPYWINVEFPNNKAEFHISYYDLKNGGRTNREFLIELMEETRRLAYEHSIKASSIEEQIFINNPGKVYGTIYRIHGNAASPMQFFLTDSTEHFLRGAFYIREVPDIDSLQPVIDFLEPDVVRLIETTNWK